MGEETFELRTSLFEDQNEETIELVEACAKLIGSPNFILVHAPPNEDEPSRVMGSVNMHPLIIAQILAMASASVIDGIVARADAIMESMDESKH